MTSNLKNKWTACAAALWFLSFALLHIAWAAGWYIGLDEGSARRAFERGWFLAYDLIAAGLCFLAVALALALVQSWGRGLPRFLINAAAWICMTILVLRGTAGIVKTLYLAAAGNNLSSIISFWDLWFCLGAMLFAASVWRFWRERI